MSLLKSDKKTICAFMRGKIATLPPPGTYHDVAEKHYPSRKRNFVAEGDERIKVLKLEEHHLRQHQRQNKPYHHQQQQRQNYQHHQQQRQKHNDKQSHHHQQQQQHNQKQNQNLQQQQQQHNHQQQQGNGNGVEVKGKGNGNGGECSKTLDDRAKKIAKELAQIRRRQQAIKADVDVTFQFEVICDFERLLSSNSIDLAITNFYRKD